MVIHTHSIRTGVNRTQIKLSNNELVRSLAYFIETNDVEGVNGALIDPRTRLEINVPDLEGLTPILRAARTPGVSPEVVQLLLTSGASVDTIYQNEYGEDWPLMSLAVSNANLEVIQLLEAHGAKLAYNTKNASTWSDLASRTSDDLAIAEYLIKSNIPFDESPDNCSSPIFLAYLRNFNVVRVLLLAGADDSSLKWTALHCAACIGSIEDVMAALQQTRGLDAVDAYRRTATDVAAIRGDLNILELLFRHSPAPEVALASALNHAAAENQIESVKWLLDHGAKVNYSVPALETDNFEFGKLSKDIIIEVSSLLGKSVGIDNDLIEAEREISSILSQSLESHCTPLSEAVANGSTDSVILLLERQNEFNISQNWESLIQDCEDSKTFRVLLSESEAQSISGIGLTKVRNVLGSSPLGGHMPVTFTDFQQGRHVPICTQNPEDITQPYRVMMVQLGRQAHWAGTHFNEERKPSLSRRHPIWCADRFGQSVSLMPDGRLIFIGGEHEDYYDENFCIYNDVIVAYPDGDIKILGYPTSVFPPTDFHTATTIGDRIYILGGLGYADQRKDQMPAYVLDTVTYEMKKLKTSGTDPGWIFEQTTTITGPNLLQISGGKKIVRTGFCKRKQEVSKNESVFILDLSHGEWLEVK